MVSRCVLTRAIPYGWWFPALKAKYHVKWLKGIKVVEQPYMTYWEQSSFIKGKKHVKARIPGAGTEIGHHLPVRRTTAARPRLLHIRGLAWSGGGAVRKVEVSTDGGRTWNDADLPEPPLRIALDDLQFPWTWNGGEAVLQSRCTDDTGRVQPAWVDLAKFWSSHKAPHGNPIQPWRVTNEGHVLECAVICSCRRCFWRVAVWQRRGVHLQSR